MDAGHDPDDVLELGSSRRLRLPGGWRPTRAAAVLAAAALAVGLAAGYAAGDRHATAGAPRTTPTRTVAPGTGTALPAPSLAAPGTSSALQSVGDLVQGLSSCSVQHGREIQLGVEITNESPVSVALRSIKAVTPLGGLRQVTRAWGTCGALPDDYAQFDNVLAAGQSTWLTVTFKVTVRCPIPYPVQFTVGYLIQGHSHTASLPGFVDLGQVPYSGCPAVSAGGRTIIAIDPGTGAIDS